MTTLLSLLFTAPASAGGLGVLASAGAHTEELYFYANADSDDNVYADLRDYEQFRMSQTLSNFGGGVELVLGDRDDKIVGNCRFYWLVDGAQRAPTADQAYNPTDGGQPRTIPLDNQVVARREEARHLGLGMVGLSWGFIGKPDGLMLSAVGHVGSAFITFDHTEFLAADLGPSISYRAARQVQVYGEAQYMMRYRKGFNHSANVLVGARYLFD